MNSENEILTEIHKHRAEHAKECGYDVGVMFTQMREDQKRLEAAGWKVVTLEPRSVDTAMYAIGADNESCVLREEPPIR